MLKCFDSFLKFVFYKIETNFMSHMIVKVEKKIKKYKNRSHRPTTTINTTFIYTVHLKIFRFLWQFLLNNLMPIYAEISFFLLYKNNLVS